MAIQKKTEIAYSFFKYEDTDEIHIFKGQFTTDSCTAKSSSICNKIKNRTTEKVRLVAKCLNEDQARTRAARIGRAVCGICVSHLYTTYEE